MGLCDLLLDLYSLVLCSELTNSVVSLIQFSSLLLVLILMLSTKNSAHGRAVGPQLNKGRSSEQKTRDDCPTEIDSLFPTSVEVSINISNTNDTTKMAQDVNLRSLSPWNYRYNLRPFHLEMHSLLQRFG